LAGFLPAADRVRARGDDARPALRARPAAAGEPLMRITRLNVVSYTLGSFGTGVFSTVPAVLLLYYCTNILRIPPLWGAGIVFVPKVWAIVWDPIVGIWSDRASGRFGRRRPFLAVGAAGVAAAFFALFCAPHFSTMPAIVAWIGAAYFALATLYSLFAVPYIAIPPEIGFDSAARARLVRWRMFVAMIGVLAGAGLAPVLVSVGGGGRAGYAVMAAVLAAACCICMAAPLWMLRKFDRPRPVVRREAASAIPQQLRIVFRCRRFLWLSSSYLAMLAAVGALTAAAPYLIVQVLGHAERDVGMALGAMLIVTTLTIPAWSMLGRRFGDRAVLAGALIVYVSLSVSLGLSAHESPSWAVSLGIFAALGAPFAAAQVLPFTLLAHLVHDEVANHGGAEGVFTGLWTAAEKVGLALGPSLVGIALAVGGQASVAIPPFIAIVPAVLMLAALVPLYLSRFPSVSPTQSLHAHQ
jgi:Na+/melibiose symporter-like transporter